MNPKSCLKKLLGFLFLCECEKEYIFARYMMLYEDKNTTL